jgi:hypothetical protein
MAQYSIEPNEITGILKAVFRGACEDLQGLNQTMSPARKTGQEIGPAQRPRLLPNLPTLHSGDRVDFHGT